MNAKGISVFYGAFEKETCVAEIRPPVGSYVVIGKFEFVRDLRLLDLDLLADVRDWVSHFDPNYVELKGRFAFLRFLVEEISRPVMPGDEASDYLPTQAVAEYPREQGGATARRYYLSFNSDRSNRAPIWLLFNRASLVDLSEIDEEATKEVIDISVPRRARDDDDSTIFIWERDVSTSSGDSIPGGESTV